MKPYVAPVQAALGDLQKATMWLMQNAMAKPDNAGAASYDYMHLFGRVALGYDVGEDRRGGDREEGARTGASGAAWTPSSTTGALLHGAHAAGNELAPRAHHERRATR